MLTEAKIIEHLLINEPVILTYKTQYIPQIKKKHRGRRGNTYKFVTSEEVKLLLDCGLLESMGSDAHGSFKLIMKKPNRIIFLNEKTDMLDLAEYMFFRSVNKTHKNVRYMLKNVHEYF